MAENVTPVTLEVKDFKAREVILVDYKFSTSTDAMTADWAHLPYDFMAKVSNEIINKVRGVNQR